MQVAHVPQGVLQPLQGRGELPQRQVAKLPGTLLLIEWATYQGPGGSNYGKEGGVQCGGGVCVCLLLHANVTLKFIFLGNAV